MAHRFLPPVRCSSATDSDWVSRFSRLEFLCVHGVSDSAGPRRTRAIAPRVFAFRLAGHRLLPDSQISELNTPPTYTPVQRFKCSLTTALAWLGARLVRYSFSCMKLSFTTPGRFIPTLSLLLCLLSLSEQTGFSPSPRERLLPGFRRFGHPPRRRIYLQCQLGNLHRQGFHLLDQQLASLHHLPQPVASDSRPGGNYLFHSMETV